MGRWTFLQIERIYVRNDGKTITEKDFNNHIMVLNAKRLKQSEAERILDALLIKLEKKAGVGGDEYCQKNKKRIRS